jgi:hypothetical protein
MAVGGLLCFSASAAPVSPPLSPVCLTLPRSTPNTQIVWELVHIHTHIHTVAVTQTPTRARARAHTHTTETISLSNVVSLCLQEHFTIILSVGY